MLITIPLHQYNTTVTSHSATDELYSLGTDNYKACLDKFIRNKYAVYKIRMHSQGSMDRYYTRGKNL